MTPRPILVVSGWYPSVDGRAAGRFVADQVAALRSTGSFRPVVVSFDPLPTWGSRELRVRERAAVLALATRALEETPGAVFRPWSAVAGAPGPVARLPVPGPDAASGPAAAVADRLAVIEAAFPAIVAEAGPPVLVHAHTGLPDGVAAARFARRHGIPLVLTEHASTLPSIAVDPVRRALYLEGLSAASAVLAVSRALAADITALDPSVAARLHVIANVVAVDEFGVPPAGTRVSGELLFVGFRKPGKGMAVLLDAFAQALAERPALRLRLIGGPGSPEDERRWRSRADTLGIAAAVSFEPETDRPGVAAAMRRADLFVHPSPRETFGVVAAEALASGLPVVAADSGGVAEVLGPEPHLNGWLVPRDDPGSLADAILVVLARRDEYPEEELRRRVVDRFGPAAIAGQLAGIYATALGAPAQGGDEASPTETSSREPATLARSGSAAGADSRFGTVLIIGSDRVRAARVVGSMPADLRSRVVLVTADGPAPDLPVGLAAIHLVGGLDSRHAARRAVQDTPGTNATARRRLLWRRPLVVIRELLWRMPWRERALLRSLSEAADTAAADAAVIAAGQDVAVAGLDAFDALVESRLVRLGRARPLPGGGRWLADTPDSAGLARPPAS